jgi:hypothetical protein
MRSFVIRAIRPIHSGLRRKKVQVFLGLLEGSRTVRLLDVGGATGMGGEFWPVYRRFSETVIANLDPPLDCIGSDNGIRVLRADGCCLPFPDRFFDWVFSNAVIEHVGGWVRQTQFANEIRRVASQGYFVTTPNKFFPIEQHTLLPMYQFLSKKWQKKALRLSPGYLREFEDINLLSRRQLQTLFPEAQIVGTGTPGIANSLVALYRHP